jgi:hypothetical protein
MGSGSHFLIAAPVTCFRIGRISPREFNMEMIGMYRSTTHLEAKSNIGLAGRQRNLRGTIDACPKRNQALRRSINPRTT